MSETNTNNQPQNGGQTTPQTENQTQPTFDYDKLASLIAGKQTAAEDTVLKSYFKEQGLSADEMKQAINAFKKQKAESTPNVAKLQNDFTAERSARLQAVINQNATLEAIKQGVDINSVQYLLKMADFKDVTDENGNVNAEKLTEAVKKVLDDVPALKGANQTNNGNGGIQKIGGDNGNVTEDTLRGIFGIKSKN